jgi:hypothetical protein
MVKKQTPSERTMRRLAAMAAPDRAPSHPLPLRIVTRLDWWRPEYVGVAHTGGKVGAYTLRGKRESYTLSNPRVPAFELLRVKHDSDAQNYLRQHGPLREGETVARSAVVADQKALRRVRELWSDYTPAYHRQSCEAARGFDLPWPQDFKAGRLAHVGQAVNDAIAKANVALTVEQGTLTLRPRDLHAAIWLMIAQRLFPGDASIPCRRIGCEQIVARRLDEGRTMRGTYCGKKCAKQVERRPELDRYPELRRAMGKRAKAEILNSLHLKFEQEI